MSIEVLRRTVWVATIVAALTLASGASARWHGRFESRTLSGAGNNRAHRTWGAAGTAYPRVAPPRYRGDGSTMASGPDARWISNRVFNDLGQNIFSERGVTQWAWTWGQFVDHTIGRAEAGTESAPIPFDSTDPLESFRDDFGQISFTRDEAAPGTGSSASDPRQQVNAESSYIDAFSVYGGTSSRLEWLRRGRLDGNLRDNGAQLRLPGGYLPRADSRGDPAAAPEMDIEGALAAAPGKAVVAGDVRANENLALTAVQTLFAREHNRIVRALPRSLGRGRRFAIARRVVGAEMQWITFKQFLPALGVHLSPYRGYRQGTDAAVGNEFATVGYRAHSMIHGEFELEADAGRYSSADLDALEKAGVEIGRAGSELKLSVPLDVAFFSPQLLERIGLGPVLAGLAGESQYRNDEQIDNTLRSLSFELPGGERGLTDLGATDVQRGRDHGMPTYNELRRAYGLAPVHSFRELTGEPTDRFDRRLARDGDPIENPAILDFVHLFDSIGRELVPGTEPAADSATVGIRRSPLAARLRAIYGSVDDVDAFVGMVSEQHLHGSEMGPLQEAIWARQFEALRDGDRFFYGNDPILRKIRRRYGIDYRRGLAQVIDDNSDAGLPRGSDPFLGA